MLVLCGIAVIVAGFLLRFNPLLVVAVSALVTGLAAGIAPLAILAAFGKAFNENRYVTVIYIVLPVIAMLERHGLQERARLAISKLRGARLIGYLLFRQFTAALGLTSIAGPAQSVRPLVAPMAEAAAEAQGVAPGDDRIPAMAAATDNIGLFFGEDIFIAIGSILLMKGVLEGYGIVIQPLHLSMWAIPTAIAAFLIHGFRLWLLDRRLARARRSAK
ncbi:DUF969 domain-containing protein [Sphingomonas sp. LR59]|uniref:DUF969 domain-containing protein n=1 Tax=Sphingomonas sp. LR59 TaxID=3050232 RepID=UPI002FE323AB